MKPKISPRVRWVLAAALGSGFFWALLAGPVFFLPFKRLDWAVQDAICRGLPLAPASPELVFLSIDEGAFNLSHLLPEEVESSPALTLMAQDFPWSRAVYAELFDKLMGAGASAVVADIHFALPGKGDEALAEVIGKYPGKIVLGSVMDYRKEAGGALAVSETPPAWTLTGEEGAAKVGFVNFWSDPDGVVRSAHYKMSLAGAVDVQEREGDVFFPSLAAAALGATGEERCIPWGESRRLRFAGERSFLRVPIWQVFVPDFWNSNLKKGEVFSGKIVVLGAEAARFRDVFRTPISDWLPGPLLHINAISCALRGDFLWEVSPGWSMAVTVLLSFLTGVSFLKKVRPLFLLLGLAGWCVCFFFTAVALVFFSGVLLPVVPPVAAAMTVGVLVFSGDFAEVRKEKARVRRVLERYVSKDIVGEVLDNPSSFLEQLGGVRKEVVVLFSDLRGFTALTEVMEPGELVVQLNQYLSRMVEIVFRNGGTVDKFVGDAVMAVWGTVKSFGAEGDARGAVRAAEEMFDALEELNRGWEAEGKRRLSLGVGIHAGGAVFGNMGSEQKMEPTVIGDTVNLASRAEGLCKHYGVSLVFTEAVWRLLPETEGILTLDRARVFGRKEAVEIFTFSRLAGKSRFSLEEVERFNGAVGAYRGGEIGRAAREFREIQAGGGGEFLCEFYLGRCREVGEGEEEMAAEGWDPVFDFDKK